MTEFSYEVSFFGVNLDNTTVLDLKSWCFEHIGNKDMWDVVIKKMLVDIELCTTSKAEYSFPIFYFKTSEDTLHFKLTWVE